MILLDFWSTNSYIKLKSRGCREAGGILDPAKEVTEGPVLSEEALVPVSFLALVSCGGSFM